MSATGNELVKLSQLRGTINELRSAMQSTSLTDTNNSITRTTGGSLAIKDGQELVKQVEGQSYVANQLVPNGTFAITTGWANRSIAFSSFSVSNNIAKLTITDNTLGSGNRPILEATSIKHANANNKYLVSCKIKITTSKTNQFEFLLLYGGLRQISVAPNQWVDCIGVVQGTSYQTYYLYISQFSTDFNIGDTIEYQNCNCIDLTTHFGSNSAIPSAILNMTTLDTTLLANYGIELNGVYQAPTLVSSNNEYKNTNADSTKSALLSYNGTLERKVGVVDLGSLNYTYVPSAYGVSGFSSTGLASLVKKSNYCPCVCAKYINNTDDNSFNTNNVDKEIVININGWIKIKDSTYTDAQAFKTAMSGVILYYELATPTTEQIVNATNVELRGVGTAKDTLYNESGLACWKDGTTTQVNKNGIVAIPYSVSEEFAVSINGQLGINAKINTAQTEALQELKDRMFFTDDATKNPAQIYGGNWTQVGTQTIDTTTIYVWKKGV